MGPSSQRHGSMMLPWAFCPRVYSFVVTQPDLDSTLAVFPGLTRDPKGVEVKAVFKWILNRVQDD